FRSIGISNRQTVVSRTRPSASLKLGRPFVLAGELSLLWRGRNKHPVRRDQIHIRYFAPELYRLQSSLLGRLSKKCQEMLRVEPARQVLQIGSNRPRRPIESDVIGFAAGPFRNLREIKLSPIGLPIAMTEMAGSGHIDRGYENAATLR